MLQFRDSHGVAPEQFFDARRLVIWRVRSGRPWAARLVLRAIRRKLESAVTTTNPWLLPDSRRFVRRKLAERQVDDMGRIGKKVRRGGQPVSAINWRQKATSTRKPLASSPRSIGIDGGEIGYPGSGLRARRAFSSETAPNRAKFSFASSRLVRLAPPGNVGSAACTWSSSQPHTEQISKVPGGCSLSVKYPQQRQPYIQPLPRYHLLRRQILIVVQHPHRHRMLARRRI
jgi:hypothetical protein